MLSPPIKVFIANYSELKLLKFVFFFVSEYFYYFVCKMSQMGKKCWIMWIFDRSYTKEERRGLVKIELFDKNGITLYEDWYVVNNCGKKRDIMKKTAMEQVRELINKYSIEDKTADVDEECTIRSNNNSKLVDHNRLFINQVVHLLFKYSNKIIIDSSLINRYKVKKITFWLFSDCWQISDFFTYLLTVRDGPIWIIFFIFYLYFFFLLILVLAFHYLLFVSLKYFLELNYLI